MPAWTSALSRLTLVVRRWFAPRPRTTPMSRSWSRPLSIRRLLRRSRPVDLLSSSALVWRPRHLPTPPAMTSRSRPGLARPWHQQRRDLPNGRGLLGHAVQSCVTAKTPIRLPRCTTRINMSRGWPMRSNCRVRRCPITTSLTPMLLGERHLIISNRQLPSSSTRIPVASL